MPYYPPVVITLIQRIRVWFCVSLLLEITELVESANQLDAQGVVPILDLGGRRINGVQRTGTGHHPRGRVTRRFGCIARELEAFRLSRFGLSLIRVKWN